MKPLERGLVHADAVRVHPGVRYRFWGHRFLSEAPSDPGTMLAVSN